MTLNNFEQMFKVTTIHEFLFISRPVCESMLAQVRHQDGLRDSGTDKVKHNAPAAVCGTTIIRGVTITSI